MGTKPMAFFMPAALRRTGSAGMFCALPGRENRGCIARPAGPDAPPGIGPRARHAPYSPRQGEGKGGNAKKPEGPAASAST